MNEATTIAGSLNPATVVYPNPFTSAVIVRHDHEIQSISISDQSGRILMEQQDILSNTIHLDCSDLAEGLYVLHVTNSQNETIVQRMIKLF